MSRRETLATVVEYTVGPFIRKLTPPNGVTVLCYHRIGDPNQSPNAYDKNLYSATQDQLAGQIAFLESNTQLIKTGEIDDALKDRGLHVALTFDDGYRDNYELALPVLQAFGATATFFIPTGYIDKPQLPPWDQVALMVHSTSQRTIYVNGLFNFEQDIDPNDQQLAVNALTSRYKALRSSEDASAYLTALAQATDYKATSTSNTDLWMTWDMIRELRKAGMDIGGHTVNHPKLSSLTREEQLFEIAGCMDRLHQELGERPDTFAYPFGSDDSFTQDTQSMVAAQGFKYAFSLMGGRVKPGDAVNPYSIPRMAVGPWRGPNHFRQALTLPGLFP